MPPFIKLYISLKHLIEERLCEGIKTFELQEVITPEQCYLSFYCYVRVLLSENSYLVMCSLGWQLLSSWLLAGNAKELEQRDVI